MRPSGFGAGGRGLGDGRRQVIAAARSYHPPLQPRPRKRSKRVAAVERHNELVSDADIAKMLKGEVIHEDGEPWTQRSLTASKRTRRRRERVTNLASRLSKTELEAVQVAADTVCVRFIESTLVFLDWADGSGATRTVGTGMSFAAGDRVVILTAGHMLERDPHVSLRLGRIGSPAPIPGLAEESHVHPGVDVGAIILRSGAERIFPKEQLLTAQMIGEREHFDSADAARVQAAGFPGEWVKPDSRGRSSSITPLLYVADLKTSCGRDHEQRGLHLDWVSGLRYRSGKRTDLPHPGGISGGPVWRFLHDGGKGVWSSSRNARLVGICVAFHRAGCERAERADDWSQWFRDLLASM